MDLMKGLPMFRNLFTKTLYDKRWFTLGWSLGLVVMAAITIAFFPTIKDQIGTLFANVPKALESITGSTEDYKNITGYIGTGVFDLRMPMLTIVMAIILALSLSASEESSGRLYQLLAQPLSRRKIFLQKWLAMVGIFFVTHLTLFLGILLAIILIRESLPLMAVFAGTLICLLLTVAIGSLTLAFGFGQGRKGLATVLITTYAFGSYLLTSFAAQVEWLQRIEPVSLFHYYQASAAIKTGIDLGNIVMLLFISLIAVVVGIILFQKRDIGIHNA